MSNPQPVIIRFTCEYCGKRVRVDRIAAGFKNVTVCLGCLEQS